ncbi:MAG: response regulator [Planctomycetota bacterium]
MEDTEENVTYLSNVLGDHGYDYAVARNGAEALESLKKRAPDAVLLDIMMPRKTGISVLKEMKQDPALEGIPVIVTTGASEVTGVDIRTGETLPKETYADDVAREIGTFLHGHFAKYKTDGFLEKPIDAELLLEKLSEILS